jgi:hypothetical protein
MNMLFRKWILILWIVILSFGSYAFGRGVMNLQAPNVVIRPPAAPTNLTLR